MINLRRNLSGTPIGTFTDLNGRECAVQESTFGSEPALKLGVGIHHMLLNQEMAEDLIDLLQLFVQNGSLE